MVSISEKGSPVLARSGSTDSGGVNLDGKNSMMRSSADELVLGAKSNTVKRLFSKSQSNNAVRLAESPAGLPRDAKAASRKITSRVAGPLDSPPPIFNLKAARDRVEAQILASLTEGDKNAASSSRQVHHGHRFSARDRESDLSTKSSNDPPVSQEFHKIYKVILIFAC
jgi:hypothetical protein